MAVGTRSALKAPSWHYLEGDALEVDAALDLRGQHRCRGALGIELDEALRLVPTRGQDERGWRFQRGHRAQGNRGHPAVLLHVEPRGTHRERTRQPRQQLHPGVQIAVVGAHQPAHLREHELLAVAGPHTDQLAMRHAFTGLLRRAHHAHALRTLVLDQPLLYGEALGVAVVVFLARADAAESGDFLALLRRELALLAGRFEDAARDVVVDASELAAGLRGRAGRAPVDGARRLGLAPLAIEVDQQVLAGGLHAVLAQRKLRRRLALAQQRDAIAQALRELAGIEIARFLGTRFAPLGAAVARQIGDQRRHAFAFVHRLRLDLELRAPALEQKGDEGELALGELVRVTETHQHAARIGDARRGVLDIAVQKVLYRVLRDVELLRGGVSLVQRAPVVAQRLAVGAVVVEHAQADVGE